MQLYEPLSRLGHVLYIYPFFTLQNYKKLLNSPNLPGTENVRWRHVTGSSGGSFGCKIPFRPLEALFPPIRSRKAAPPRPENYF
jgi:hypothetical protein